MVLAIDQYGPVYDYTPSYTRIFIPLGCILCRIDNHMVQKGILAKDMEV